VNIEKIEALYRQGTAEHREDGFIVNPPFFGVVDGFSAPYHSKMEKILFDGMSGGEMIRRVILETFYAVPPDLSLEAAILYANLKISEIQTTHGIPIDQAGLLAGASFVLAKVKEKTIEITQGGDCFTIWDYGSGKFGATKNQAYQHVSKNLEIIAELMEKHHGNRKEMWVEFCPILSKFRQRDINNPEIKTSYAVINGQSSLRRCWQEIEIPVNGLKLMIFVTDGFFWYPESVGEIVLAKKMLSIYKELGLDGILTEKREGEKRTAETSYIDHDEATGLALEFRK